MEWLTAILAFATTMLIFSMITSTLVETFHRLAGSRSFGLIKMLEYFYDDIIGKHLGDDQEGTSKEVKERKNKRRRDFVERMILVRAPAWPIIEVGAGTNADDAAVGENGGGTNAGDATVGEDGAGTRARDAVVREGITGTSVSDTKVVEGGSVTNAGNPFRQALGFLRDLWFRWNGASRLARDLGVDQRRLLSHLPVVTFMERLGSSAFTPVWNEKYAGDPKIGEQVLQDIGQKFELYGQEASVFFERKARRIAVFMALFVAWTFYVHPYDFIQTYLQRPEVAAKVADMNEELLKDGTQSEVKELLAELQAVEAPVGWTADKGNCKPLSEGFFCWFYLPDNVTDAIWLLIGGLLVGLGAPFWAKAVRQIAEVRKAPAEVGKILRPETEPQTAQIPPASPTSAARSEAIAAFYVAVAGHAARTGTKQQETGETEQ